MADHRNVKDPAVSLECCRCRCFVHVEEGEQRASLQLVVSPFVCPDCVQVKMDGGHVNVLPNTGAPPPPGRLGLNSDTKADHHALCTRADCSTPSNKKPRALREHDCSKSNDDVEAADVSNFHEEVPTSAEVLKAAAAVARRAATAAKNIALEKAATAVQAAAKAKAALDAAAVAARAEKLQSKRSGGKNRRKVSKKHSTVASGNNAPELLAVKSESTDSSSVTLESQESGIVLVQGAPSALLNVATKKENEPDEEVASKGEFIYV